jgi:hypothetical protein
MRGHWGCRFCAHNVAELCFVLGVALVPTHKGAARSQQQLTRLSASSFSSHTHVLHS